MSCEIYTAPRMMGTGGPTAISYDSSRFNPKPSADYLCPICHCVLFEPRMCPCQHIFCRECIETWLARSATCPTCRNHTMLRQMLPAPPLVQSVLNSLTMDCDYKDKGCVTLIPMERFASHLNNCDFRPAKCPFDECQAETTVHSLPEHKGSCQYRREKCTQICCLEFPFYKLEKHDCVITLKDKVQELTKRLIDHQVMLRWMRLKLNHCHLPQEAAGIQIKAYHRMVNDINLYWPTDQAIPVGLLGPLVFAPAASTVESSQIENDDHIPTSSNALLKKIVRELSALDNDQLDGRLRFSEGERPAAQHAQEQLPVSSVRSVGTAVHTLLIPYETHHEEEQEVSTARRQTRAAEYNLEELIGGGRSVGRIRNPWAHWGDLSEEDVGHVDRNYGLYHHMYPDFHEWRTPHDVWNLRSGSSRNYMDELPGPSNSSPRNMRRNRSRSRSVSNERSRSRRGSRSPSIVYERSRSASRSGSGLETYNAHLRSRSRSRSGDYNQSPRSYAYRSRSGSPSSYSTRSRSGRPNSRDSFRPADEFHDSGYSPQGLGNVDSYRTRHDDRNYGQSPLSPDGHGSDRAGPSYDPRDDVPYLGDRTGEDVWVYISPGHSYRSPDPQDGGEWSQDDRTEENGNRPTAREVIENESDSHQYSNSPSWTLSSYSREHTGQDNMSDSPSSPPEYRSSSSLSSSTAGTDQNLSFQESAGVDQRYSDQDELEDAQSLKTVINGNSQTVHDLPADDSSRNQGSVRSPGSVVEGAFSPSSSILHSYKNHDLSISDSASSFSSPMNSRSWKSGEKKPTDRVQGESGIPCSPGHHSSGRPDHEAPRGLWDSYSDTTSLDYELDSPRSLNGKGKSTNATHIDTEDSESGGSTSADKREGSASPARSEDKWFQSSEDKKGLSKKSSKNKHSSGNKKPNCVSPSERDTDSEGEPRNHSGYKQKQKQNFHRESNNHMSASSTVDDSQPSTSGQQHAGKKLSIKGSHTSLKSSGKDFNCHKRKPTEDHEQALPAKKHKTSAMQSSGQETQHTICRSLDMPSTVVTDDTIGNREVTQMETVVRGLSATKSRSKRSAPAERVVEEAQAQSTSTFNVEATGSSLHQNVHHKKHHRHDHHARKERVHQAHNNAESPDQGTGQRTPSAEQSRSHSRRILHSKKSQRTDHMGTNSEEDAAGLLGRSRSEREETGQSDQRLMTLEPGRSHDAAAVPVESSRPSIGRGEADGNRGVGCGQAVPPQGSQRRVTCADGGRESRSRHDLSARGIRLVTIEDLPLRPSTSQLLDIYTSYNEDESDSTWSPSSSCSESTE